MKSMQELRLAITGESEDARFEAWKSLYHAHEPEQAAELDAIITGQDSVIKILLARFLAQLPAARAITLICQLLNDDNPAVSEAARKAFEKNQFDKKINALMSVLKAPTTAIRLFAIEKLASGGVMDALPVLVSMLKGAPDEMTSRILTALRYLPEKSLLIDLFPYFSHANDEFRFKTVLVFGAIHETGVKSAHAFLTKALSDAAARVRQAAIWSLRRQPRRRDLNLLRNLVNNDPDAQVRQECVLGLSFFHQTDVIETLLQVLATDKSRMVTLRAEAALLTFPRSQLLRGLKQLFHRPLTQAGKRALFLFAEFEKNSPLFFRHVCNQLRKAPNDAVRLIYIEVLGILGQQKATAILEVYLVSEQPLIAYAALASLLHIYDKSHEFPYYQYLTNPALSDILRQMVLKHFLKIDRAKTYPTEMMSLLTAYLDHNNLNVRYLSALALARLPGTAAIEPLLYLVLREENPLLSKFLNKNITRILATDPVRLTEQLLRFQFNAAAIARLLDFAKELPLTAEQVRTFVGELLSPKLDFLVTDHLTSLCALFVAFLIAQRISLDDFVVAIRLHQDSARIMTGVIQGLSIYPQANPIGSAQFLLDELLIHRVLDGRLLVELMSYGRTSDFVRSLVSILTNPSLKPCHAAASKGLTRAIGGNP